jgi:hypothetical protein
MMSAHDRQALLRAFYGLAALWLVNGVFGLLRAAGPGALLPYIEVGLLFGYWIFVFNWWRTHRPKSVSQPAKKSQVTKKAKLNDKDIARAVDREEAISAERNRRRRQQRQKQVSESIGQLRDAIHRFRLVIVAVVVMVVMGGGYQVYQGVATNIRMQEEAQAREDAKAQRKVEVGLAIVVWDARNACVKTELGTSWSQWYAENPQTQTQEYLSITSSTTTKWVKVTRVLPMPNTLEDVRFFGPRPINPGEKPTEWVVTQSHFEPLVLSIRQLCTVQIPAPTGLAEEDMALGSLDLSLVGITDQTRVMWKNPFPSGGFGP